MSEEIAMSRAGPSSSTTPSSSAQHQVQEISFLEKGADGKTTEKRFIQPKSSFLNLEEFQNMRLDTNSESWNSLNKGTKSFYLKQNDDIDGFREVEERLLSTEENDNPSKQRRAEKLVIWVSFSFNVLLITSLILAVVFSGAISVIASVVDSSLDLFSAFIIIFTNRAKNRVNRYKYPQGKERLEPVGVLIFSAVMGTASLLLIIEAIKRLLDDPLHAPEFGYIPIGFLAGDIVIKMCLYIFCRMVGRGGLTAKALAQDHRNDVVLNSVALITAFLGSRYWGPLDPIGAILISLWTMYNWGDSCLEQVRYLTGRSASPEFLKRLTWICFNHDPQIIAIDTVRAFHFGTRYLVEIDIVLPPDTPLRHAHDIGEALQKKVELLEDVERAFVHLDFETDHNPMSEHKQWGE